MSTKLEQLLKENDLILSRTVKQGRIDAGISTLKRPSLLSEAEMIGVIDRNRSWVSKFVWSQKDCRPTSAFEPNGALLAIAFFTNNDLAAGGLLRLWEYKPQVHHYCGPLVPPQDIAQKLWTVGHQVFEALTVQSRSERQSIVAGIEWDIGIGPLHPFYDGCGRISRYFSAMSSLWLNVDLVRHESRVTYMAAASDGRRAFADYYASLPAVQLMDHSPR